MFILLLLCFYHIGNSQELHPAIEWIAFPGDVPVTFIDIEGENEGETLKSDFSSEWIHNLMSSGSAVELDGKKKCSTLNDSTKWEPFTYWMEVKDIKAVEDAIRESLS